jgi:hypothetical protein
VQINMGEGKTRVIIPILILHWTLIPSTSVVRLYFLTQLLAEGFTHLHQYLWCSVLERKLFLLLFNRDIVLTSAMVQAMHYHVMLCLKSGGCLIVAPEHSQSLYLKWHELHLKCGQKEADATCLALDKFKEVR